jgi:hypothetical protein
MRTEIDIKQHARQTCDPPSSFGGAGAASKESIAAAASRTNE